MVTVSSVALRQSRYPHPMTKPMNAAAYARATGREGDQWVANLDGADARGLPHTDIVALVQPQLQGLELKNTGWWAQGLTIAYEQHIGRRIAGQRSDGTFANSISKAITGTMDDALTAWTTLVGDRKSFLDLDIVGEPSSSATEKWRYWRCGLADSSRVAVTANEARPGKARLAVEHSQLSSPDAAADSKDYWKSLISEL